MVRACGSGLKDKQIKEVLLWDFAVDQYDNTNELFFTKLRGASRSTVLIPFGAPVSQALTENTTQLIQAGPGSS